MPTLQSFLNELQRLIDNSRWHATSDHLFRILYGQAAEKQIDLLRKVMRRFLPIYEARYPDRIWVRRLIDDPFQWCREFGRAIPDTSSGFGMAGDGEFEFCFSALTLACVSHDDTLRVTSSCASGIEHAILAQVRSAWAEDDPRAFEAERTFWSARLGDSGEPEMDSFCSGDDAFQHMMTRTEVNNAAAQTGKKREWALTLEFLRQSGLGEPQYEISTMENDLKVWSMDYEGSIIPPPMEERQRLGGEE